jgi:hypothetical protein
MRETADFAKTRQDNPDDSTKIATAAIAGNIVANEPGADAVVSGSLEKVAVWVNEGSAGGEIMR